MLIPTPMKRELIFLGLFLCLVMLSFRKEENKVEQPLTNAEKIARDVQKAFGAFDAVYYFDDDSLAVMYTYRPEANNCDFRFFHRRDFRHSYELFSACDYFQCLVQLAACG